MAATAFDCPDEGGGVWVIQYFKRFVPKCRLLGWDHMDCY